MSHRLHNQRAQESSTNTSAPAGCMCPHPAHRVSLAPCNPGQQLLTLLQCAHCWYPGCCTCFGGLYCWRLNAAGRRPGCTLQGAAQHTLTGFYPSHSLLWPIFVTVVLLQRFRRAAELCSAPAPSSNNKQSSKQAPVFDCWQEVIVSALRRSICSLVSLPPIQDAYRFHCVPGLQPDLLRPGLHHPGLPNLQGKEGP